MTFGYLVKYTLGALNSNTSTHSNINSTSSAPTAALHRFKALSCALACATTLWTGTATAQVPVTDGVHISTQIGQWVRNYQQWQEEFNKWKAQFLQNTVGQINSLKGSMGLSNYQKRSSNAATYQAYIEDFKQDQRCKMMSNTMAQGVCEARRTLEAKDLETLIDLLNYSDGMQDKINAAVTELDAMKGTADSEPEKSKYKLQQIQAMQDEMMRGVQKRSEKIGQSQKQIELLEKQQANLARTALSGKYMTTSDKVANALIQAAALKLAFTK